MTPKKSVFSFALALALILASSWPVPLLAQDAAQVPGTSRIVGRIFEADGKTAHAGAAVVAYHLSSEKLFRSAPTGSNGEFEIEGLPYGYFDVAVDTPGGRFVGNQVVNLAPAGKATVALVLTPFGNGVTPDMARDFAGGGDEATGLARLRERATGAAFWQTPGGIAIIAGGGALTIGVLASGGGDDNNEPVTFCGDGTCDPGETVSSCAEDCEPDASPFQAN